MTPPHDAVVPSHFFSSTHAPPKRRRRRTFVALVLYVRALLIEFRWTILGLLVALSFATALFATAPVRTQDGRPPNVFTAMYAAWMSMLAQPVFEPPLPWYLTLIEGFYPLIGALLVGEGVVRLALLMTSKRQGEKEWMRVMAATYRDHVILCGLGNLGIRVLQQLVAAEVDVVVIELCETGRFVAQGKALGVPVLIRDMKDDQSLYDAGMQHARAIIICTNDDVGNIEVALDARRMNPDIRIVMRLFEQDVARKIKGALAIDAVFSASSLAAPTIAAMSLGAKVLGNVTIGGMLYLIAEVPVEATSALAEHRVEQIETDYSVRVLAITDGHDRVLAPAPLRPARVGERLIVHVPATQLMTIAEAGRAARDVSGARRGL